MASEPAQGPIKEQLSKTFQQTLDDHRMRLDPKTDRRKALEYLTGVSQSQVCDWDNGVRLPGRDRINQICWRLAGLYDEQNKRLEKKSHTKGFGSHTLDGILNEMLEAAGYASVVGAERDQVWTRLAATGESRELRIGYVDYPPFASGDGLRLEGFAVEVMNEVAKLLGVRPVWVDCKEWGNIIDYCRHRQVDVVAPILLELPSRMFEVAFTNEIPDVEIGISALINHEYVGRFEVGRPNLGDIRFNVVKGEIGESLCSMFAPGASSSEFEIHDSFKEARVEIERAGADGSGRVRCLVADNIICQTLKREAPTLKTVPSPFAGVRKLRIAAAVHPEEPRFLQLINKCLKILEGSLYPTLWNSKYGKELNAMGIGPLDRGENVGVTGSPGQRLNSSQFGEAAPTSGKKAKTG